MRLLEDEGVAYLLIGGYAVGYYGYPRATADMDVWVAVSPENARRVVGALVRFGIHESDVAEELFLEKGNVVRMGLPPMRLGILTDISGVEFDACFSRRLRAAFGDLEVSLISLADLKVNKRASGRHKDLEDLEHLP